MVQNLEKGTVNLSHHQLIRPQWPPTLHKSHLHSHKHRGRMIKTIAQAHAVVTVPSSFRPKVSFASMAKVLTTLPQQHAFPVTHHNKMEQTSLLSQWLIDS